ncbi:hypothetical protein Peur_067589 [Populus x canadensis]
MTKLAFSPTLLLVCLCTVSAAFMKCSLVYQPLTSVGLLHKSFCLKNKTLPVIHACSHRKRLLICQKKRKPKEDQEFAEL